MDTIVFNNGKNMPILGLGTYKLPNDKIRNLIEMAYNMGYRKLDTARYYHNEDVIGKAIKEVGIPRKDLFISTKIDVECLYMQFAFGGHRKRLPIRKEGMRRMFFEQCERLGTDYIDMYLLHAPIIRYFKYWEKEVLKLYKEGYIKSFGVCSFSQREFEAFSKISSVIPMMNQIEVSPYNTNKDIISYCTERGVRVEAFATFGTTKKNPNASQELLNNDIICDIAKKHKKAPSQIVLKWVTQQGFSVVPKASSELHLKENMDIFDFELTDEDMRRVDSLDQGVKMRYFR